MTTDPGPISRELWARLRLFDATCFIAITRTQPYWCPRWRHLPRVWYISIHHHQACAWEYVRVEHPDIEPALREAVEQAEQKGWDRRELKSD